MRVYYLGIDGGGSSCDALLENEQGEVLARSSTGPANASHGIDKSMFAISRVTFDVISQAGLSEADLKNIHVGIGLAGIGEVDIYGISSKQDLLRKALEKKSVTFKTLTLSNDLFIACYAAHKGNNGAVVVVGTGTAGITLLDKKGEIKGGHGFLLGDQASGAWLGKKALRLALLELEGLSVKSELSEQLLAFYECQHLQDIKWRFAKAEPYEFAQFAPRVIKLASSGNASALAIVKQAASYLENLANCVSLNQTLPLRFMGGLSKPMVPFLNDEFVSSCQAPLLLSTEAFSKLASPTQGAILFTKHVLKSIKT